MSESAQKAAKEYFSTIKKGLHYLIVDYERDYEIIQWTETNAPDQAVVEAFKIVAVHDCMTDQMERGIVSEICLFHDDCRADNFNCNEKFLKWLDETGYKNVPQDTEMKLGLWKREDFNRAKSCSANLYRAYRNYQIARRYGEPFEVFEVDESYPPDVVEVNQSAPSNTVEVNQSVPSYAAEAYQSVPSERVEATKKKHSHRSDDRHSYKAPKHSKTYPTHGTSRGSTSGYSKKDRNDPYRSTHSSGYGDSNLRRTQTYAAEPTNVSDAGESYESPLSAQEHEYLRPYREEEEAAKRVRDSYSGYGGSSGGLPRSSTTKRRERFGVDNYNSEMNPRSFYQGGEPGRLSSGFRTITMEHGGGGADNYDSEINARSYQGRSSGHRSRRTNTERRN